MARDPWDNVPVVRDRSQQPARGQVVRRADGSSYVVTNREYTNETPTQLLNQGYYPDENGVYARTTTIPYEDAPWNAVPAVEANPPLQSGNLEAAASSYTEQLPGLDEAAAFAAGLLTGTPYSEVRALQGELRDFDRQNYRAARNVGGVAGFATGLVAPGAGYIQGARGASAALRAGQVGGAYGGLYGLGAGEGSLQDRAPGGVVGALGGAVAGAGLQAAGSSIASRLRSIASPNPVSPRAQMAERVADFDRVGVDPTLAGVGGPVQQRMAQTLSGNILTGGPVIQSAGRIREQTANAVDNIAGQYGSAEGRATAGAVVRRSAEAGATRMKQEGGSLYEPINRLEQADTTPIPLANAQEAVRAELGVFQTPALRDWFTRNATDLADIQNVLQNAEGQTTLAEARRLRSIVGRMLDDPEVFQSQSEAGLRRMYGALSDDIMAGAQQLGGDEAAQQLSRADAYYSAARTRANDTLKQFYDVGTDAEAYNRLVAAAQTKGNRSSWQTLRRLKDTVTPEEWGDIGSGVIRSLGQRGDDFSPAQFATQWENMTPQARRVLFGGQGRAELFQDLNALARVSRVQRDASRFYNASESGNVVGNSSVGAGLAVAGQQAMSGNFAPLITVLGTGAAGNGLSRILTSPGVARWAAKGAATAARDGDALARRNQVFADWWSLNREAVTRAVAQNEGVRALPVQAAAEEESPTQ